MFGFKLCIIRYKWKCGTNRHTDMWELRHILILPENPPMETYEPNFHYLRCFCLFVFSLFLRDRVPLCGPSCAGSCSIIEHSSLKLRVPHVCLPSAGIKSLCHHNQPEVFSLRRKMPKAGKKRKVPPLHLSFVLIKVKSESVWLDMR